MLLKLTYRAFIVVIFILAGLTSYQAFKYSYQIGTSLGEDNNQSISKNQPELTNY